MTPGHIQRLRDQLNIIRTNLDGKNKVFLFVIREFEAALEEIERLKKGISPAEAWNDECKCEKCESPRGKTLCEVFKEEELKAAKASMKK